MKGYCDKCMKETNVKRISTGGGSGAYLCSGCLKSELQWRKERNKTLAPGNKFKVKGFKLNF